MIRRRSIETAKTSLKIMVNVLWYSIDLLCVQQKCVKAERIFVRRLALARLRSRQSLLALIENCIKTKNVVARFLWASRKVCFELFSGSFTQTRAIQAEKKVILAFLKCTTISRLPRTNWPLLPWVSCWRRRTIGRWNSRWSMETRPRNAWTCWGRQKYRRRRERPTGDWL